jgi:hypothetical protein
MTKGRLECFDWDELCGPTRKHWRDVQESALHLALVLFTFGLGVSEEI